MALDKTIALVCSIDRDIGLGHYRRLSALAECLFGFVGNLQFFLVGNGTEIHTNKKIPVHSIASVDDIASWIEFDAVVFDMHQSHLSASLIATVTNLYRSVCLVVGVDSLRFHGNLLDINWIPSFYLANPSATCYGENVYYGWDAYLLPRPLMSNSLLSEEAATLVSIGASDVMNVGEVLPQILDEVLPPNMTVNWVKGPFAPLPRLPSCCRLKWFIHDSPQGLEKLIAMSNFGLSVFGISFFEMIRFGLPCVAFSPYHGRDTEELDALKSQGVAVVANDLVDSAHRLSELISNPEDARALSQCAQAKMSTNGAEKLADLILQRIAAL